MQRIKVTFANGETCIYSEGESFQTIVKTEFGTSQSKIYQLRTHTHDALIPDFTEMLVHGDFFFNLENPQVVYSSHSVVKLENL